MQDHTFTLIVSAVGIGGTLAGIVIGHFLTRSWQSEQWRLDKRREEYRELLTSLSASYSALKHIYDETNSKRNVVEDISLQAEQAKIESLRVLYDRILIADEVRHAETLKRWTCAVDNYLKYQDGFIFSNEFFAITAELVTLAKGPEKISLRKKWDAHWAQRKLDKAVRMID